jgi:hypothetical protein
MNKTIKLSALAALLALLIALSACVGNRTNQGNLAGRINGKAVPYEEYMQELLLNYYKFQYENNRAPDSKEKEAIKKETWDQKAKYVILSSYYNKYGINVSAQETVDYLKDNPPEALKSSPLFMTDGKFDNRIYLQSLLYDTPHNLKPYRDRYQTYLIPDLILQERLIKDELLNSSEKKLIGKILRSNADIEWTILDEKNIDPWISDEEINYQYQKNLDAYKLEPYISLAYTELQVLPSRTDIRLTNELADSLYTQLKQGTPIAEILAIDHPIKPFLVFKNSDFIKNNDIDPQIYAQLSTLNEGEYGAPIPDAGGVTIHQLETRTKSMSSFNTLRIPYLPAQTGIDAMLPAAQQVVKLARSQGLAVACEEMNLTRQKTGKTGVDSAWIDDPAVVSVIKGSLEGKMPGDVFDPVYSQQHQGWLIVELAESVLNSVIPLEEVREQIRQELASTKRAELADQIAARILSGEAPVPADAEFLTVNAMEHGSQLLGVDAGNIFYLTLRRHLQKDKQQAFLLTGKVLIPKVLAVREDKTIKVEDETIRQTFVENLPTDWFAGWMDKKVKDARIIVLIDR